MTTKVKYQHHLHQYNVVQVIHNEKLVLETLHTFLELISYVQVQFKDNP